MTNSGASYNRPLYNIILCTYIIYHVYNFYVYRAMLSSPYRVHNAVFDTIGSSPY